jgi:LmbE family N-acetylglucosaminyl deacetylase
MGVLRYVYTALVISPHADDAAVFCGGTLAKWAAEGWRLILARVTDDAMDSVGLDLAETVRRNSEELREAAAILGIAEVVDLGFPTDSLADVPHHELRRPIVHLIRKYRPYAIFSFDPYAPFEPNRDHVRVAQAVEEALWVACFDKHHPEDLDAGLRPCTACERWYFARRPLPGAQVVDITPYGEVKIEAFCAHRSMLRNVLEQYRLHAASGGIAVPALDDACSGDPRPLVGQFLRMQGEAVAMAAGLPAGTMAEAFRMERFGEMEAFFQATGEPLPGVPPLLKRAWLES